MPNCIKCGCYVLESGACCNDCDDDPFGIEAAPRGRDYKHNIEINTDTPDNAIITKVKELDKNGKEIIYISTGGRNMKKCNNADCKLMVDANSMSCNCGYVFVDKSSNSNISDRGHNNTKIENKEAPKLLEKYIWIWSAILIIGAAYQIITNIFKYILLRHTNISLQLKNGVTKNIQMSGYELTSEVIATLAITVVVWAIIDSTYKNVVKNRSNRLRIVLLILTFPVGLILLDKDIKAYTNR